MAEIELIRNFEKISFVIPNRLLKLQGYLLREESKEFLEIIIYKGFSSSTTHQTEFDLEKLNNDSLVISLFFFKKNLCQSYRTYYYNICNKLCQ